MKMILKICASLSIFLGGIWSLNAQNTGQRFSPRSLITLLAAHPSDQISKIQVAGYLALDFEGEALYLHKEDYDAGLTRNAIRISLNRDQETAYKSFTHSYVVVEASFVNRRNSTDIFTGSLFDVLQVRSTVAQK